MAPNTAMVTAGPTSPLIVSHDSSGTTAPGSCDEMLKRSPIVSILVMPAYCFSSKAATVIRMIATSEPGSARNGDRWNLRANMGHEAMSATETIPTKALHQSIVPILYIYIGNPLFDEITWYLVHRQSQQVFHLRREDGDGNTACKSHHDGVGNVLDDGSQT